MNIESTRSFKSIEREFGHERANSLYGFVQEMSAVTAIRIVTEKMENFATKKNLSDATNELKLAIADTRSTGREDLLNVKEELKDSISAFKVSTREEFSEVRESIAAFKVSTKEEFSEVRESIAAFKVSTREEFSEVRESIAAFKVSTKEEFSEVRESIAAFKLSTKEEFSGVRESISDLKLSNQKDNNSNLRWTILLWISQLAALAGIIKFLVQK